MALTQEQKAMKQKLHKINRRIAKIAEVAGTGSTYYQAYETPMLDTSKGKGFGAMQGVRKMINLNGEPVFQFNLDKRTIDMMLKDKTAQRWISKFEKMPTLQKLSPKLLSEWEKATGIDTSGFTDRQKQKAVREQFEYEERLRQLFQLNLEKVYEESKLSGEELEVIAKIKMDSRGRWSDNDFYRNSIKEMTEALQKIENESLTESKSITENFSTFYDTPF